MSHNKILNHKLKLVCELLERSLKSALEKQLMHIEQHISNDYC